MEDHQHKQGEICSTCSGPVSGYKCEVCGEEAQAREEATHVCGDAHCLPKCVPCENPESKCVCPAE